MKKKRGSARGSVIQEWREHRGLTQKQLADKAGLHVSSVGAYERGERTPGLEKLARICLALDVEAKLFCGEVAQVEAGELQPLIDGLKREQGVQVADRPEPAPQPPGTEELGHAWNLLSDHFKGILLSTSQISRELPEVKQSLKALLQLMERLSPRLQD